MKIIQFGLVLALLVSTAKMHAQTTPATPSLKMAQMSLLVKDYEEALLFYTETLGFDKKQDIQFGGQRWLTIAPQGQKGTTLVLVKVTDPSDSEVVGKQAGNRTLMVLETDDFDQLYQKYQEKGVRFISKPSTMAWGRQVQFLDLYGNHLVLLDTKVQAKTKPADH